jgi:hypothetical protein
MAVGIFSLDSAQKDRRSQDVAQSACLDDQDPCSLGGIVGTSPALPVEFAGPVPDVMPAVKRHLNGMIGVFSKNRKLHQRLSPLKKSFGWNQPNGRFSTQSPLKRGSKITA